MKTHTHRPATALLLVCIAASLYGAVLVHSAGGNAPMQLAALFVGMTAAIAIANLPFDRVARYRYVFAAAAVTLVALTFTSLGYTVPGTDDRNWLYISVGERVVLLQPSELLKIAFLLTFSLHLACVQTKLHRLRVLLPVLLHAVFPAALVLSQGDDGNAAVLLVLSAVMLFCADIRWRWILLGSAAATAAFPVVWAALPYDKRARFLCLWDIESHRNGVGWQQDVSVTAIGSGQAVGVGLGNGGNHGLYALHNDFIFTAAAEENGFIGAMIVLLLLSAVLVALFFCARRAETAASRLFCLGMLALVGTQAVINVGMTLRIMPVLGITLPFFSAGGSSLLTLFFGVGLCMSAARHVTA